MRRRDARTRLRAVRALAPAAAAAGEVDAPAQPSIAVASRTRTRTVPAPLWLGMIIAVSIVHRLLGVAAGVANPWVFYDELIYTEFARSFADGGGFALRDVPLAGVALGFVYPALLAPIYMLASDLESAYAAVKVVNVLVMSSAAVPAYLLARRVLTPGRAVVVAAVAVALPSFAHVATVMTENAFYPVFLWFAFAAVRCLEQPTLNGQLLVLGLAAAATLTRAQGVFLLAAFLTAIGTQAWLDRRSGLRVRTTLGRYRITWLGTAVPVAVVGAYVLLRSSPAELIGSYSTIFETMRLERLPRELLSHVAILDLSVGVAPFAGTILLAVAAVRRQTTRAEDALVAMTVALIVWLVAVAAAFATLPLDPPRIQERYIFYVTPLLAASLLVAVERSSHRLVVIAAVVAALLPATLPFAEALSPVPHASTPSLIPWLLASPRTALIGVTVLGIALAATLLARRRAVTLASVGVLVYLVVVGLIVDAAFTARADVRRAAALGPNATWIDDAVGESADVALVWSGPHRTGDRGQYAVWFNEFYNESVRRVYAVKPTPDWLPTTRLHIDRRSGAIRELETGTPFAPRYVVADRLLHLRGTVVAKDAASRLTLYRLDAPARLQEPTLCRRTHVWSWERSRCLGRGTT